MIKNNYLNVLNYLRFKKFTAKNNILAKEIKQAYIICERNLFPKWDFSSFYSLSGFSHAQIQQVNVALAVAFT